ncbi:hypothetical protein BCU68_02265 [Vibrio sp. 10N.286.49.B3]|uniref:DUF1481 domain-containing protein n=1 Tax=Vibrio sp. 10N.286.49.B3 TaxID=1880855 RepID=UPI000C8247BF|nr:DUF1481 domain-containing protein [Vibrio sp. 10N.286.49.B3]PMH46220.1 hypothetical protein BCU68_02265 [Vibrio sp. 10N.286.49.B3]
MKKILVTALLSTLLAACSSTAPRSHLDQVMSFSSAYTVADTASFYWYSEKLLKPLSGADYVVEGSSGWYKTDYRWNDNGLSELIREGEQRKGSSRASRNKRVPYRVHVRFNQAGEAVYQQYRIDGKVYPLNSSQMAAYKEDAALLSSRVKASHKEGYTLIQGYWDGSDLKDCQHNPYAELSFTPPLPNDAIRAALAQPSFVAFSGAEKGKRIAVEKLILSDSLEHACVEKPQFLEE